ncbi:MAG: lipocalin family protein [Muribaculaceae bacterium]|nr:lipocalin family protein [Muribaculaceae bacterium]
MEKLKYFGLVLMVALCAGFVSCSDDDDEENAAATGGSLVGTWQGVTSYVCEKISGQVYDEYTGDASDMKIEFKSDGTFVWYDYYDEGWHANSSGNYSYSDGRIIISYSTVEDEGGESGQQALNVLELSESTLILEFEYSETYNGVTYSEYEKLTLRRI